MSYSNGYNSKKSKMILFVIIIGSILQIFRAGTSKSIIMVVVSLETHVIGSLHWYLVKVKKEFFSARVYSKLYARKNYHQNAMIHYRKMNFLCHTRAKSIVMDITCVCCMNQMRMLLLHLH